MATLPSREELRAFARKKAEEYGLDPAYFVAQIQQESGFNPNVRKSKAGAQGIAQFMPATARAMGVDTKDPYSSIDGAARYMAQLKEQFGNEDLARQAYNWGQGNLRAFLDGKKRAMPRETVEYNTKIAAAAKQMMAQAPAPRTAAPTAAPVPARAAGAPYASAEQFKDNDLMALAFNEMNQGMEPGTLLSAATQPTAQPSWIDTLTAAAMPASPRLVARGNEDAWENMDTIRDKAIADQERLMARMFADLGEPQTESLDLPPAIDRYLEKTLAA